MYGPFGLHGRSARRYVEDRRGPQGLLLRPGKSVFFLLVPQKTSDVEFELRFDDRTCRVPLSDHAGSHDELLGGMQLHVELTLKEGRVEIGKTTIEGWGDQGTVEGEIIL